MPAVPLVRVLQQQSGFRGLCMRVVKAVVEHNARSRVKKFQSHIRGKKLLDVGLGGGSLAHACMQQGYTVDSVDVVNASMYETIQPTLYDGEHLPFVKKSYDTGLLIYVLHHCTKPLTVLSETMRVSKRVIVFEDTYRNWLEKIFISIRDSVGNFEFYPHTYRTTQEWTAIFRKKGWKVVHHSESSTVTFYGMYGHETLFVLEPVSSR